MSKRRPVSQDADAGELTPAALQDAAAAVQEAAAVVQEAAANLADAARSWPEVERRRRPRVTDETDPRGWPEVDRRRKLRLPALHRDDGHVDWKHVALYAAVLLVVIVVGALALWAFIEKQSLVIEPAPLPKVTLVTSDPNSPFTAAWVKLLGEAEMQPTLVPVEQAQQLQGVVVICGMWHIPPQLQSALAAFVSRGGAVVVLGPPPAEPVGTLQLSATGGVSDTAIRLSEGVSPILARLNPGYEVAVQPSRVAFLNETPRMTIDARWRTNARAVAMHMEHNGSRVLWLGFDPAALPPQTDRQLMLMLRTAFRWVAGQPVSEGAVGSAAEAKTLTPDARRDAREARFAFSIDRLGNRGAFGIRMTNRGPKRIDNPTVKVWLPPGVTEVALGGDFLMKRGATLIGEPEEGACLISLRTLAPNEDREMKLKIVSRR